MKVVVRNYILLIAILLTLFSFTTVYAGPGTPVKKIVFFGDSLTDDGNLYHYAFGIIPKSPIYYKGRFSNGIIWAEHVANYYRPRSIKSQNYAVGGETAFLHLKFGNYLPYTLSESYFAYLMKSGFTSRSNTLYAILIGANDYLSGLNGAKTPDVLASKVVEHIKIVVENLINHGGKNFLIINLPNLAKTPSSRNAPHEKLMNELTLLHNAKLAKMVQEIADDYKRVNIQLYDISKLIDTALDAPRQFNQEHLTDVTELDEPCWHGGYTVRRENNVVKDLNATLSEDIENHLLATKQQTQLLPAIKDELSNGYSRNFIKLDHEGLMEHILGSPDLKEAYLNAKLAKEGHLICLRPDSYLFWDRIHPTRIVHKVIAEEIIQFMDSHFLF